MQNFLPAGDGTYLIAAEGQTERQIAKFSASDADRYGVQPRARYGRGRAARPALKPPQSTSGPTLQAAAELLRAGALANQLRRLPAERVRILYDLATKSAGEYLDGWFESDLVKAMHGFDAVVGNYASPYTPGTAYVLLHHAFGEVNGRKRSWGHAIGGMGAITQAMARSVASLGVEIETDAPVREIVVERDGVAGVVLADGRAIRGGAVAGGRDPRLLYTALVPCALPPDFWHRALALQIGHVPHEPRPVALPDHDPADQALPDHHVGIIVTEPRLHGRAYHDASTAGAASRSSRC